MRGLWWVFRVKNKTTMDDERLIRFLDAQEHPERYTEEQLNDLMREGKDLALLKRAMMEERARHADLDVEAEWQAFNRRLADSNRRPTARPSASTLSGIKPRASTRTSPC